VPLYVVIGRDGPRGGELRKLHRDAHLANLKPLADAGRVRFGGPLRDESGNPIGSVIIFEADDLAAARSFAESDPYVTEGIFATWEVRETTQVYPRAG
jgi:hypothetical protein